MTPLPSRELFQHIVIVTARRHCTFRSDSTRVTVDGVQEESGPTDRVCVSNVRHDDSDPVKPFDAGYSLWRDQGWRRVVLRKKSASDPATTRVVVQSAEAARAYVRKLPMGVTIAFRSADGDSRGYWLASKQSEIRKSLENDETTGITRGEWVLSIIWYENMTCLKYMKTDYETVASVSSALVTISNISWQRTTTNRFYISESCHNILRDIVTGISEI